MILLNGYIDRGELALARSGPPTSKVPGGRGARLNPADLAQLASLLGPLVSPLLRRPDGSLDPAQCPAASFEAFRDFLLTQVKADGIAFDEYLFDSYHKVLAKEEYRPLLENLYRKAKAGSPSTPSPSPQEGEGGARLLRRLTAEIIGVSAQKFVSQSAQSKEGRGKIRSILSDPRHYTRKTRADVAKAVAQVGYGMGSSGRSFAEFNRQISVMNYWNGWVGDGELARAAGIAQEILSQLDRLEDSAQKLQNAYLNFPRRVKRFSGLERELGSKINDEQIVAKARIWMRYAGDLSPLNQLKAKLARFWLLVVDDGNWQNPNGFKRGRNGAFLLRETEALLGKLEALGDRKGIGAGVREEAFLKICERVRDLINGGLNVTGEGWSKDLKDFFASGTVAGMLAPLSQTHRAPYDELRQFVEEIHHSHDMGEGTLGLVSGLPAAGPLAQAKFRFLNGLVEAKRMLWFSYKQHRTLSRAVSAAASWFGKGDVPEIRAGQRALDEIIRRVRDARDPNDLAEAVRSLQDQLREDGKIQRAILASEMEGVEQLYGLGQTLLFLLASRGIYRGAMALGGVPMPAPAAAEVLGQGLLQGVRSYPLQAVRSFGLGVYLTTAENALAAASGEVRAGGEHWLNWGKDALATGASMALTAPLAAAFGSSSSSHSLIGRTSARYFAGWKGLAGHVLGDTVLESGEEFLDAYFRVKLDDGQGVIGFDQAREIGLLTGFGGFSKMGMIGEMLRGPESSDGQGGSGHPRSGGLDGPAFEKVFHKAQAGNRKSVAALADFAVKNPMGVLALDQILSQRPFDPRIQKALGELPTKHLGFLTEHQNSAEALHALLILAGENNSQAVEDLSRINFEEFLEEGDLFYPRVYLLEQAARLYGSSSAEHTLLNAHSKFSWDALDRKPQLWTVLQFFAARGFAKELKELQHRALTEVCRHVLPEEEPGFVREVSYPAALAGNSNAKTLLAELDLKELSLPPLLDYEATRTLALLAEWENEGAWKELENRAYRETLPLLFLLNLSHHGYSRADRILKHFDLATLAKRMENDVSALDGLVGLESWGHPQAKKILKHFIVEDPSLGDRIKWIRQGEYRASTYLSMAGEVDQNFGDYLSGYSDLEPAPRQYFLKKILSSWRALSPEEKFAEYEINHKELGIFTPVPLRFSLRKAHELGFTEIGLQDPKGAFRGNFPMGGMLGLLAPMVAHAEGSQAWLLGGATLLSLLGMAYKGKGFRGPEGPILYLAVQAKILMIQQKLERLGPGLDQDYRQEAEQVLVELAGLPRWNIPQWAIHELLNECFRRLEKRKNLGGVKEAFQNRQEEYIWQKFESLRSRAHQFKNDRWTTRLMELCLHDLLNQIDQQAGRESLSQLAGWYEKIIQMIPEPSTRKKPEQILAELRNLPQRFERVPEGDSAAYGRPGWFFGPNEMGRAVQRLFQNAAERSYHFRGDFLDLRRLLTTLREDPGLDPDLKGLGLELEGQMVRRADDAFVKALIREAEEAQRRHKSPRPFLGMLETLAQGSPKQQVRDVARKYLAVLRKSQSI